MRRVFAAVLVFPLLAGCTAMGAWLYDDPSFALRAVTPRSGAAPDSLELLFLGCNRNDYDLLSDGFRARLSVSGRTVAEGTREQPVFLATRDSSSFVVVVPVQGEPLAAATKSRPFELNARSMIRTPIGNRNVVFRLKGRVESGESGLLWLGEGGPRCRPGVTALPGSFDRRAPLSAEEDTLPRRPPVLPVDPNRPGQPGDAGQPGPGAHPQG